MMHKKVSPICVEARTAARWWGDRLREWRTLYTPVTHLTKESFVNERPSKIERMFAEVEYDKLLQLLEVLKSEERIKAFEQSLAADIDNELQVYAFCSIAQDDKYHTNHILASHLQAAGIPTEQGILIPIFNMSMCTAIRPGEVWAYGSFDPNHEGEKRRLELLSE